MVVERTQFSSDQFPAIVPGTVHSKDGETDLDWACECQCQLPPLLDNQLRSSLVSMSAMLMKEGQYIMILKNS